VGRVIRRLRALRPEAVLALCGGLLLALLAVQGLRYQGARRLAAEFDARLRMKDPAPADKKDDDKEQLRKLAEKGLFGKRPSPPEPKLFGILGDSAMMGNDANSAKLYALDARLPDGSKLVELQANAVVVENDGKRKTIRLFPELNAPSSPQPMPPPGPVAGPPSAPSPSGMPQPPGGPQPVMPAAAPSMPQLPPDMPPEIRAQIEARMKEAMERARTRTRVWTQTESADEVNVDDSADDEDMDGSDGE